VTRLKWKLILVRSEKVLLLMQDRCTVCAGRTIGSEIILDVSDGTTRGLGHVESCFCLLGDGLSVGAR
jgi:hypothetical protein